MAVPSLASALVRGLTNPTQNTSNSINLNSLSIDQSLHQNLDLPIFNQFDIIFPNEVQHLLPDPFNFQFIGTNKSFIVFKRDIIRVYSISNLKLILNYQIKVSPSIFNLESIQQLLYLNIKDQEFMLILTSNKLIKLLDFKTGNLLTTLQLPFEYQYFHQIGSSNLFSLYNSSSYFSIVNLNIDKLTLSSIEVTYLSFTPITTIQLPNSHLCIIGKRGHYEVFQFNDQLQILIEIKDKSLISTLLSIKFGDPNYGKIIKFENLNDSNSTWILIQELGWVIYQFNSMRIIELISSPLISNFETLIQLNSAFIIQMTNGQLMFVSEGNVQILNSNVLSIFKSNDILWGMFKEGNNYLLKSLNLHDLTWTSSVDFSFNGNHIYGTNITEGEFTLISNPKSNSNFSSKTILKNLNGDTLCELNGFKESIRKIIDLRNVIISNEFNYMLILDSNFNITILEFSIGYTQLRRRILIKLQSISNVSYYEKINHLEFNGSNGDSILLDVKSMSIVNSPLKNQSKLTRIMIFSIDDLINYSNAQIQSVNYWNYSDNNVIVPLKIILNELQFNSKLVSVFKNNGWLGIKNDQIVITNLDEDNSIYKAITSPELALLYYIANGDVLSNWKSCINSTHFITKLCQFSLNLDFQISEISMEFLKAILLNAMNSNVLLNLFQKSLKVLNSSLTDELEKLYNSLILGLIVSIDHNLYTGKVSSTLMKYLIDNLLTLDERICQFIFHVLLKLNDLIFEKFKTNPFDLVIFFKHIFELRSEFLLNKSKRCFNSLKISTDYIDKIFIQNSNILTIIISSILVNDEYPLKSKISVIDYLNYLVLEKRESLNQTFILIITNSLIVFVQKLTDHTDITDDLWEHLNLLFNIMSNCFTQWLGIKVDMNKSNQLDLKYLLDPHHHHDKRRVKLIITIDFDLGYIGSLMKFENLIWSNQLLKRSNTPLIIIDGPNDSQNVKLNVRKILGEPKIRYQCPIFSKDQKKVAILDTEMLEILIWDLSSLPSQDMLDVEILKDDNVPLKVPNFHLIALQSIWNHSKLTERFSCVDLMTVISEFNQGDNEPNVLEPIGRVCFGDLLVNYLQVFSEIKYDNLQIGWEMDNRLLLNLNEKTIFVYNIL